MLAPDPPARIPNLGHVRGTRGQSRKPLHGSEAGSRSALMRDARPRDSRERDRLLPSCLSSAKAHHHVPISEMPSTASGHLHIPRRPEGSRAVNTHDSIVASSRNARPSGMRLRACSPNST